MVKTDMDMGRTRITESIYRTHEVFPSGKSS